MEQRRFGRTNHNSTIIIFGAAALGKISQTQADRAFEQMLARGVNHIDIAPSYGDAELRAGAWVKKYRDQFFLGCKTLERTKQGAWDELRRSLDRLQTDHFDLYQLHSLKDIADADAALGAGGAMEALVEAKAQGLTKFLGITGHGLQIPSTHLHALSKFDFDSVLFPINPVLWANENYRREATRLLELARQRDVGVMIIKAFCKRPWGERAKSYHTWYEPFDDAVTQEKCLRFALSQNGVTGLCSAGDARLIENILNAAKDFAPLSEIEQTRVVKEFAREYESLFV
ncbi:MAG: aldo/keto reductase [Chloroflexi bacterium]|nr:aldo/keto reductase [Chloroflexota bacterium]